MCGRYRFTPSEFREIKIRFNILNDIPLFLPRYNIAPSQQAPVIANLEGGNGVELLQWGLVSWWVKDPTIGNRMINARAETLAEKPSFRNLLRNQRCLIPADGFTSGVKREKAKCRCGSSTESRARAREPRVRSCNHTITHPSHCVLTV